jgi:hypothetical protein
MGLDGSFHHSLVPWFLIIGEFRDQGDNVKD